MQGYSKAQLPGYNKRGNPTFDKNAPATDPDMAIRHGHKNKGLVDDKTVARFAKEAKEADKWHKEATDPNDLGFKPHEYTNGDKK